MSTKIRRQRTIRVENQNGRLAIRGTGQWYHYWRDPYHLLLTIPWIGFVGLVSTVYLLLNALFALAYIMGGDCLNGAKPGSFSDAFFFSVQTLASIGYGAIHPKTFYANSIVTLEAIASLLLIAVVTGLAFARFSLPIAKVLFSQVAVVTTHDGHSTLMFRVANERHNFISDATAQVYLSIDGTTLEGESMRRIYELPLLRQRNPSLTLTWTIMHQLNDQSPLSGLTVADLEGLHAQISVLISGVDETVSYKITARHIYSAVDILFDRRFEDVIHRSSNGDRYFDYNYFHQVRSLDNSQ